MLVEATFQPIRSELMSDQKNTNVTFQTSWPVFSQYLYDEKSFFYETFRKDFTQKDTFYAKKIMKKEQKLVEIFQFSRSQETQI